MNNGVRIRTILRPNNTEAGEKTSDKETQDKEAQVGQKEKEGEGQIVEPKIEQGIEAQTPREKRL